MPAGDAAAYIFQEGDELMRLALAAVVGMERDPHIGPICTYFLIEGDTVARRWRYDVGDEDAPSD